jgi:drug/metabolite transporter (DMT)-like permease
MISPSVLIDRLPPILRGTVYALLATFFFSVMSIFIRLASEDDLHPTVIVFFRNALALTLMMPWLMRAGLGAMRTDRIGMLCFRSLLGLIGMTCGFWAVTLIPIAQATALSFTSPIFATIGAALILRETVRLRRWTAVIVGFLGAMIVVIGNGGGISGLALLELGVVLALMNAFIMAVNKLVLKSLTRTEQPEAIITYMVLLLTPLSLIPAIFFWEWPSLIGFVWLGGLALAGTVGHLCITRAFKATEVTVVLPFDFARLPISAFLALLIFSQVPTIWTVIGGLVIFAASFYIARREAQLAKRRRLEGAEAAET